MLTLHQLEVTIEATTPLALDAYCGSALRGAFFRALWGRFCANREAETCSACPLNAACPVSSLVAPLRDEAPRGRDVARPYIITPPYHAKVRYEPGETLTFSFTLIGNAATLYPYVIRAFQEMEHRTLGHPLPELHGKRGSFQVREIQAMHPFTEQRVSLFRRDTSRPEKLQFAITAEDVVTRASQLSPDALTIHFLSPTRLIHEERVLHQPRLDVLVLRMAQRLEQVQQEYGSVDVGKTMFGREWYLSLKGQAENIRLEHDETHWEDIHSYSARQRQMMPIGGFVGRASYTGSFTALHELLIWGELLRVGKNIVKGAGWYRIEA
ncbi:MAG: CRISPR system precrRNA processing endoribonuclease RAMP protein Cas6 [Ktedonobacteraceae bacterium]